MFLKPVIHLIMVMKNVNFVNATCSSEFGGIHKTEAV